MLVARAAYEQAIVERRALSCDAAQSQLGWSRENNGKLIGGLTGARAATQRRSKRKRNLDRHAIRTGFVPYSV